MDETLYKMNRLIAPGGPVGRCGPAFVLLLVLGATFLSGPARRHFYLTEVSTGSPRLSLLVRKYHGHDDITMNHMKVATNLAIEHNFLGFYRLMLTADGERIYKPYNRFPVGGHILIKLVTLPFSDDLPAALRAARLLMWAFFAGTMMLAYLSPEPADRQPPGRARGHPAGLRLLPGPVLPRHGSDRGDHRPVRNAARVPRHRGVLGPPRSEGGPCPLQVRVSASCWRRPVGRCCWGGAFTRC